MRRIVLAVAGTITGLVLLLGYPTSLNRSTTVAATGAVAEGTTDSGTSPGQDEAGSDGGSDSTGSGSDSSGSGSGSSDSGSGSSGASGSSSGSSGTSGSSSVSGTFTGDSVQTRYGAVQVEIVVVDGAVTSADAIQHPDRDHESAQINSWAVPALNDQVVSAQSANISMISGATVTSMGYLTSLQSAFDQAGL